MISIVRGGLSDEIRAAVRDVPDFPTPGIVFKDITPVLASPQLFRAVTDAMAQPFAMLNITHVVAIESRGFILGGPVAQRLGVGFIPVRKPGKLPHRVSGVDYALEYGTDRLEVHTDACGSSARVVIVDDVLATGGTAQATRQLIEALGATVVGFSFLMALSFLPGVARLSGSRMTSLVTY